MIITYCFLCIFSVCTCNGNSTCRVVGSCANAWSLNYRYENTPLHCGHAGAAGHDRSCGRPGQLPVAARMQRAAKCRSTKVRHSGWSAARTLGAQGYRRTKQTTLQFRAGACAPSGYRPAITRCARGAAALKRSATPLQRDGVAQRLARKMGVDVAEQFSAAAIAHFAR